MNRKLLFIILIISQSFQLIAQQQYKAVWEALNSNNNSKALELIDGAINDTSTFQDSYITNIYLQSYNAKEAEITDFNNTFFKIASNPYPYIYALWFNKAILGDYGKKRRPHQLQIIDNIFADRNANGTITAAAHYQKGIHLLMSNDFEGAQKEYDKVGNIKNWQYVGPFENLSYSGFYKNYGPLEHPDNKAEFISSSNAKVKWFLPPYQNKDGWTPVSFQFNKRTAVVYAQTFVDSPSDQQILCNAGATGAIKIWINDALVFSEYTERVTEMDTYTTKCSLQKGINRILVQLSFTESDYPNFNIRLTDLNFNAIPELEGSGVYKSYAKATNNNSVILKHFAEVFFKEKIEREPNNLINYLLLSDVYLRNRKTLEARNLIESALIKKPHNNLLRLKLIQVLIKENNRTIMLEEVAKLKKDDPTCYLALDLGIQNDIENERFDEANKKLNQRESLYGEDLSTIGYKLSIQIKEKKYNDLITTAENAYKKYPYAPFLLPIMHTIRKEVDKNPSAAIKVYEDYIKENYDYAAIKKYAELLRLQGDIDKSLEQKLKLVKLFPHDPNLSAEMANYYYTAKQYKEAEGYIRKSLDLSPYDPSYWALLGDIKKEIKETTESIAAFNKALEYDPNQYEVINKIRKLKGKSETYKLVPEIDIDDVISRDDESQALNTDVGYYYIRDESSVIMHPQGAVEEYNTYVIKITNEKGINKYKESSIGYGRSQGLLIDKSEVVKKTGARIQGEKNGNEIVFTNLEIGDVIVFKYRIQNFQYGRFGKEYWHQHYFKSTAYLAHTRYTLLVPKDQKINYALTNSKIQPAIKEVDDFKQYTWESTKQQGIKEEPLMPAFADIAPILHLSTVSTWQEIANWYADLITSANEEGYEVTTLFNNLLPSSESIPLTQFAKAQRIYDYIQKNIRYSSVSFRQSAYLPQKASTTLTTRLGDCKDLSNLFMILCKMAGISCKMVLVDTYENGTLDMVLPSLEFNHCITKVSLDYKDYFIELTDNHLPFASLPNNLINALILEIPQKSEPTNLKTLSTTNRTKDIAKTYINITPLGSNLHIVVNVSKFGHLSSSTRATFGNLSTEKQLLKIEEVVAGNYKNNIEMKSILFNNIDSLLDSIAYSYSYIVKDEIAEIGSIKTFKILYPDVIASLTKFASDVRLYPINYNEYEDIDEYETAVVIEIPDGKKIIELPSNENLSFKKMTYSLQYKLLTPGKLKIIRKFFSDRNVIPAQDYLAFKNFVEKIVKAEQKMIAFQ